MKLFPLVILAAGILLVMVLTWGSVGSAVMAFCLIMMAAALIVSRFLVNRDDDWFQEE